MFPKNYHLHWIAGRANILTKYIIYIFFNFGRGFYGSKSSSFLLQKNFEPILAALYFYIYELKMCLRTFKI